MRASMPGRCGNVSPNLIDDLSEQLERHEETGNAETALLIGGEVWDRGDVLALYSRPEFEKGLNFACRIRADEVHIESLVDSVSDWFAHRNVSPHFRDSPLTRPTGLAHLLEQRGFVQTESETQMVLAAEDTEPPSNPHVTVEPVALDDIPRWVHIQHDAFGGTGEPSELMVELARASMHQGRSVLYLARLEGMQVGAASLMEWAGVLGIYGVAVDQHHRRQGVATALVRQMVADAHSRSSHPICLQVETGSRTQQWYERMGFRVAYNRSGWTLEHKGTK